MFATSVTAYGRFSHLWQLADVLIRLPSPVFLQSHLLLVGDHLSWRVIQG